MSNYYFTIISSILNIMFLLAGFDKLFHFNKVVMGLMKRIGSTMPMFVYQGLIIAAIVIEIVCPIGIFLTSLNRTETNDTYGKWMTGSLILFTIMATVFYHFPPTTSVKYYPFMSNLSLVGGLLLMYMIFDRHLVF